VAITDFLVFSCILTLNAFFCASETALTGASEAAARSRADSGSRRGKLLLKLLADRPRVVTALLIGQNIAGAVLAVYSSRVIDDTLGAQLSPVLSALLAVAVSILLLLVFGEVIPKTLAVRFATPWALFFSGPVFLTTLVFWPVTAVLAVASTGILRLVGKHEEGATVSVDEIQTIAKMGQEMGVIDSMEMEIVQKASVLNETKVRDIMVPRTDIHAIPARLNLAELRQAFKRDLFSRTPVYLGDLDDIIGVLNFKELLRLTPQDEARFKLQDYLHPALFVPEAMSVGVLLTKMRERRTHMAIVIDEYGGTSGLVTFEDIVEVLVGRVEDEYDVTAKLIERRENGLWEVDGRLTLEELEETLGVSLGESEKEGVTTAAGLALKAFGKIPAEGDATTFNKLSLKVTRMRDQRVRRLELRCIEECPAETEGRIEVSDHPLSDESAIMPLPRPQPPTSGSQP